MSIGRACSGSIYAISDPPLICLSGAKNDHLSPNDRAVWFNSTCFSLEESRRLPVWRSELLLGSPLLALQVCQLPPPLLPRAAAVADLPALTRSN